MIKFIFCFDGSPYVFAPVFSTPAFSTPAFSAPPFKRLILGQGAVNARQDAKEEAWVIDSAAFLAVLAEIA